MKRNLSSQAIKAMAIGMAVVVGSSSVSSLSNNSLVKVYADQGTGTNSDTKPAQSTSNKYIEVELGATSYAMFEITADDNTDTNDEPDSGTVKLLSITDASQIKNTSGDKTLDGSNQSKAYKGTLVDSSNLVKVDYNTSKKVHFEITEIGNGTNAIATGKEIDATDLNKLTSKVTKINKSAFSGVTVNGNLEIPKLTDLGDEAFHKATFKGNLTIKGSNVQVTDVSKIFKDLTVTGDLDLSNLKFNAKTDLSDYGLGANEGEFKFGAGVKGVTVGGELKLPSSAKVDNGALANTNIGTLDLSTASTLNDTLPKGLLQGATIKNLKLKNSITTLEANSFGKANITIADKSNPFEKITTLKAGAFGGATVNGNLDFSGAGKTILKNAFGVWGVNTEGNKTGLGDVDNLDETKSKFFTINGNLNLSQANLEQSDQPIARKATINGDLNLSKTKIPTTTKGAFPEITVTGKVDLTGVTELPENTFKDATFKTPVNIDATKTNIKKNALALKEGGTVNLVGYTNAHISNIDENAFGEVNSGKAITITVPFGTSATDIQQLQAKIKNKNVKVIEATVTIENTNGKYTFQRIDNTQANEVVNLEEASSVANGNVALVGFEPTVATEETEDLLAKTNKFEKGVLTYEGKTYTLAKLGNSTNSLNQITSKDLEGHLDNVTEVSANAFKDNTGLTSITLPKVAKIGANAFANTNIQTVDLGSLTTTIVEGIEVNAFGTAEGKAITINVPFGTDRTAIKSLQTKLENKKAQVVEKLAIVNNAQGTYTFARIIDETKANQDVTSNGNIALVSFNPASAIALNDDANMLNGNTFENGILTHNDGKKYTLTKVGNGIDSLNTITNDALAGHTDNVTEISANAFSGNDKLTNVSFPKVEKIGSKAFANTNVSKVDLGSQANTTTIEKDAFDGVSNSIVITTNDSSKDAILGSIDNNNIVVNGNKKPTEDSSNGSSNGSSNSSSGGSSSAGGAVVNPTPNDTSKEDASKEDKKEESTSNEDKVTNVNESLTLDVIKLPSIDGEAKTFGDVSNDYWAKAHIDKLSTAGIINGSNGMFNPNGKTKRADVTVMLVNLLGLTPEANNNFSDVNPNTYYAPYVGTASAYGIVNGSNGMFNPESVISRQDTMVMISQILKSLNTDVNTDDSTLAQYTDVNNIAPYAKESIAILVNAGIIKGNNGKLNPTAPVTRAEMATIMSGLYDILDNIQK